jgi:hypothetical protein
MRSRIQLMWRGHSCPRKACIKRASAKNSYARRLLALVLLTTLMSFAQAQRIAHTPSPTKPATHFNSPAGNFVLARHAHPTSKFHRSSPLTSLLSPFFGDSFDPEDLSSTGDPSASQPPAFLLQAARTLAGPGGFAGQPDNTRAPSSSQPLLIELQGDRYVQVNSTAIDGEALPLAPESIPLNSAQLNNAQPSKSTRTHLSKAVTKNSGPAAAPAIASASPAHSLPPAVLIFRDGHSEEVHDYTIADGFLYARGDFYTDGYWNKQIDLSTLNLAQTMQANSTRNVKFILPSSPNEVITRP